MKSINNFIYERRIDPQPKDVILHFKDLVTAYLYYGEFSGQISDGKYENASPANHWEWINTAKIVVDGNEYYSASYQHSKNNYSFTDFTRYIKNALDNDRDTWALRILHFGRMAKALESMGVKEVEEKQYFDVVCEVFGDTLIKNPNASFEDTKSEIPDYWEKYTSASKFYSKKYFEAFKKAEYNVSDFKNDIKSIQKTINTFKEE